MLIKNSGGLSRRRLLHGAVGGMSVAVSLPLLDIFLDDGGTAMAAGLPIPQRFGTWFWGLGVNGAQFTPKTTGANWELTAELQPLKNVKQHINVFTNFNVLTDGKPNLCHFTGWVALRCGGVPGGRGQLPGESLDTAIGDVIGAGRRFRSLDMTATGVPRDSYSFRSADAINPPETSAVDLYTKVFAIDFQDPNSPDFKPDPRLMMRKSVLSGVQEETKALQQQLGAEDRRKLDQYMTSIRELEGRLDMGLQKPPPAPQCHVPRKPSEMPVGVEADLVRARHRAMTDLLVMALACNQTNVFNMVYSDSFSALVRKGSERTHHILTHEEPMDPEKGLQPGAAWFVGRSMEEWAYFVEAMSKMPEGDGTLLDHSLIYAHSDCEFAKAHTITGIPMFTAGRLNGKVKTGLHVDGGGNPGTQLGYTVQRLMGVSVSSWGQQSLQTSREIGEIIA